MSEIKKNRVESLDEIVFENRNKEYGAYQIRKRYNKNVIKALGIAFSLLLFITITPLIMAFNGQSDFNFDDDGGPIVFDPREIPKEVPPPLPPPIEDEKIIEKKLIFIAPVISDSVPPDMEIPIIESFINDTSGIDNPINFVETNLAIKDNDKPVELWNVTEKPEFPGGDSAMFAFITKNIDYPEIPRINGVTGKVTLKFVIDTKGQVTDIEIIRGVDEYLDKEAFRVVSLMPNWKPGKQNGEIVSVTFRLPINYKLGDR